MTFEEARAQFPVLERYAYLNAGTVGPLPRAVADAVAAEHRRALHEGRVVPAMFPAILADRERARAGVALLIGVDPDRVALTTSTSEACNVVLNGLALREGDEVVTTDAEHFGVIGPLAVSKAAVRVAAVRDRPPAEALESIVALVTERTRLIALSHVTWVDGHVLPWRELRERTGVPVLVDGAQSAGAIRVDARDADFYTVSAQKWLCAPDLTGALYMRDPDSLGLTLPSYLSQERHDPATATFDPRAGAARFDTHFTPLASMAGLLAALELRPDWAYDRAREAAARCRELLAERVEVVTEPGHATLVAFRADDPEATVVRLYERGVIVREIPGTGRVRVSCGWWTSDEDLERLVEALPPN